MRDPPAVTAPRSPSLNSAQLLAPGRPPRPTTPGAHTAAPAGSNAGRSPHHPPPGSPASPPHQLPGEESPSTSEGWRTNPHDWAEPDTRYRWRQNTLFLPRMRPGSMYGPGACGSPLSPLRARRRRPGPVSAPSAPSGSWPCRQQPRHGPDFPGLVDGTSPGRGVGWGAPDCTDVLAPPPETLSQEASVGFVCGVNSRGNGEGWRLGSHGPGWHSPRPPAICATPGKCPALSEPQRPDEPNERWFRSFQLRPILGVCGGARPCQVPLLTRRELRLTLPENRTKPACLLPSLQKGAEGRGTPDPHLGEFRFLKINEASCSVSTKP